MDFEPPRAFSEPTGGWLLAHHLLEIVPFPTYSLHCPNSSCLLNRPKDRASEDSRFFSNPSHLALTKWCPKNPILFSFDPVKISSHRCLEFVNLPRDWLLDGPNCALLTIMTHEEGGDHAEQIVFQEHTAYASPPSGSEENGEFRDVAQIEKKYLPEGGFRAQTWYRVQLRTQTLSLVDFVFKTSKQRGLLFGRLFGNRGRSDIITSSGEDFVGKCSSITLESGRGFQPKDLTCDWEALFDEAGISDLLSDPLHARNIMRAISVFQYRGKPIARRPRRRRRRRRMIKGRRRRERPERAPGNVKKPLGLPPSHVLFSFKSLSRSNRRHLVMLLRRSVVVRPEFLFVASEVISSDDSDDSWDDIVEESW